MDIHKMVSKKLGRGVMTLKTTFLSLLISLLFTTTIFSGMAEAFNLPDTGQTKCFRGVMKSPAPEQGRTGHTTSTPCPTPTTAMAHGDGQ
jgi:hypothetical protein